MISRPPSFESQPTISRQATAWIASLAIQAGLTAASATGATAAYYEPLSSHEATAAYGTFQLPGTGGSASIEYFGANNQVGYPNAAV